jgi:hypothetical protein
VLVLIDADPIVYRCGFASETVHWHVIYENGDGNTKEIVFTGDEEVSANEQMRSWLALHEGKVTILDKSRVIIPDPVSHALRATNVQVESIITECQDHFKQPAKMLMWISGRGGTYRDKIATIRPYKGNRDPTHKPVHYDAIRDHLQAKYGSFVTRGIEADDAVSIFARNIYETGGESLVIATIDKDLDQIPGHHYNYMNKVFYAITPTEAERFFVYQILAGDATDNVIGVWKCGESAAAKHINRLDGKFNMERNISVQSRDTRPRSKSTEQGMELSDSCYSGAASTSTAVRSPAWWPDVVRCYADSQHKPGCPYATHDPAAVALEMAQLVKLQEYPGQLWHSHGDLVVPGFGEENFDG